jgi:hypothetical protein
LFSTPGSTANGGGHMTDMLSLPGDKTDSPLYREFLLIIFVLDACKYVCMLDSDVEKTMLQYGEYVKILYHP